jgi:uncharacterized OB-fold protein
MTDGTVTRDEASAPFFDAAASGRLLIRRCADCGHWVAPYTRMGLTLDRCPRCGSERVDWAPSSGEATLVTWTVVHTRDGPSPPVGVVELAEGPWMTVRIDADPAALAAGMALAVGFDRPGGGEPVPVFRPSA